MIQASNSPPRAPDPSTPAAPPTSSGGWSAMPPAAPEPPQAELPPKSVGQCSKTRSSLRSNELGYRAVSPTTSPLAGLRPRWKHCYNQALMRLPGLAGKVVIRFEIEPGGRVCRVSDAGSTITDPGLIECVLNSAYTARFPPSEQAFSVVYPVQFQGAD